MGLKIALVRATDLTTNDKMGNGNPYFKFEYGGHDWSSDEKKGNNPTWNNEHHEFHMAGNHSELYVLHKDKDWGADNCISCCAINLNDLQTVTNGWFTLYDANEQPAGKVLLNIGKDGHLDGLPNEQQCNSFLNEHLKKEVKKMNMKANVQDYGAAAGMLGGAAYLAKKEWDKRHENQTSQ
eukprot:NODE_240_length_11935_cov_0.818773.p9 type:complete len:181 gc:universal NODE_240_length_11935_cov_0.818773:6331-6873(+)